MRITIDFDNWDEMEAFRTSGKKTRGKKGEDNDPAETGVTIETLGPATVAQGGQPVMPPMQGFTAPQAAMTGFPGIAAAPAVNPLVAQIIVKLDGALATGQNAEQITGWFRNLLGPDAATATLDQIKQVFIPRLAEPNLKQLAQQVGIPVT